MRIVMLSQFHRPVIGGEERHVVALSETLAMRGHEVSVLTLPHPDRDPDVEENGVRIKSVGSAVRRMSRLFSDAERPHTPPFPDPELMWRLAGTIRAINPDVVHGHNWMGRSFLPSKPFFGKRLVVTLHDYSHVCARKDLMHNGAPCAGPHFGKCARCASKHYGTVLGPVTSVGNGMAGALERTLVDKYVAVSKAVAQSCGLLRGKVPFEIIPTFIPDDLSTRAGCNDARVLDLPSEDFILFVGDLNTRKGVPVLLKAYERLQNAPPLVLIGRRCPDTPSVLPPNVRLFESWPHPAVMHAWKRCLFGVAPSVWAEACGTIVMEANAVARPMIASRTGGLSDLVEDEQTGLLVPPGDVMALTNAMQQMLDDGPLRRRMAVASASHVERFMAKSIVPRIEGIYRDLVDKPHRTPAMEHSTLPANEALQ